MFKRSPGLTKQWTGINSKDKSHLKSNLIEERNYDLILRLTSLYKVFRTQTTAMPQADGGNHIYRNFKSTTARLQGSRGLWE